MFNFARNFRLLPNLSWNFLDAFNIWIHDDVILPISKLRHFYILSFHKNADIFAMSFEAMSRSIVTSQINTAEGTEQNFPDNRSIKLVLVMMIRDFDRISYEIYFFILRLAKINMAIYGCRSNLWSWKKYVSPTKIQKRWSMDNHSTSDQIILTFYLSKWFLDSSRHLDTFYFTPLQYYASPF